MSPEQFAGLVGSGSPGRHLQSWSRHLHDDFRRQNANRARPAESDDYFRQWALAHRQQRIVRLDHPLMHFAEKCLEKDAGRRFQTYDEILAAVGIVCRKHGFPVPQDEQDADAEFLRQWGIAMSLSNLGPRRRSDSKTAPDGGAVAGILRGLYGTGRAYMQTRKLKEALQATEKSLALNQYSTAAWNNLGGILVHLDRSADAKNAYLKSLNIEPENTGAMISLAQLHMDDGRIEGSTATV